MEAVDFHTAGDNEPDRRTQARRLLKTAFALRKLRRWNDYLERATERLDQQEAEQVDVRRERLLLAHRYRRALGIDPSQSAQREAELIAAARAAREMFGRS